MNYFSIWIQFYNSVRNLLFTTRYNSTNSLQLSTTNCQLTQPTSTDLDSTLNSSIYNAVFLCLYFFPTIHRHSNITLAISNWPRAL